MRAFGVPSLFVGELLGFERDVLMLLGDECGYELRGDTPAEQAGIMEGDRIVRVDTASTDGWGTVAPGHPADLVMPPPPALSWCATLPCQASVTVSTSTTGVTRVAMRPTASSTDIIGPPKAKQSSDSCAICLVSPQLRILPARLRSRSPGWRCRRR